MGFKPVTEAYDRIYTEYQQDLKVVDITTRLNEDGYRMTSGAYIDTATVSKIAHSLGCAKRRVTKNLKASSGSVRGPYKTRKLREITTENLEQGDAILWSVLSSNLSNAAKLEFLKLKLNDKQTKET